MLTHLFGSDAHSNNTHHVTRLVHEYIQRNSCEFLNPIRSKEALVVDKYDSIEQYWTELLSLDASTFMKGFRPISHQYKSLYEQLFHHYFEHPVETEKRIRLLQQSRPLQWFPPHWFEHSQPLPSGRMGQVYLSQCRLPWKKTRFIVREINLCMISQGDKLQTCPNQVVGITATRSKQNHRRLAFVSVAADATLEQLIPQVDQWSFQKTYRTALMIASSVRDFHQQGRIHPNLQPRNIAMFQPNSMTLIDDWPCIPLSSRYGRYPYIAPEICYAHAHIDQQCNMFSLGVILWQLGTGVLFPSATSVSPSVYAMDPIQHMDPAYNTLVMQCLSTREKRPTADQVCDALVRILMSEMACPRPLQPHATCVRERQSALVKYLACFVPESNPDLQLLMQGSSITKRMMLQVAVSLERHHLYWHPSATAVACQKKQQQQQRARRLSQSSNDEQENTCQDEHGCYVLHKKKHKYQKRSYRVLNQKNDASCSNIYGADLPDLMQMGLV
ncbi:kinase-like domain-containing protein [Mucor lusitanicus]|uniref:Kinase-like domain-containing protein n=1 Tax=Mucor circinelloides f. lusitanicus TaxID=29924 RepID=A0A8H4B694_MUCCL|nr:kinase-like domain-containing protein [Mucor lusitanicus]